MLAAAKVAKRHSGAGGSGGVIPSKFDYRRAATVDAALDLLAEYGDDAKLMAGGHSLLPLMKLRLAAPEVIVDMRTDRRTLRISMTTAIR